MDFHPTGCHSETFTVPKLTRFLFGDHSLQRGAEMAEEPDPKEIADIKEVLIANMIEIQTIYRLLIDRGLITEDEYLKKLEQTRNEYRIHN